MSILIEDMEFPTACRVCRLETKDCKCAAQYEFADTPNVGKRADCPLIEVPTPHGRLGDLDVLYEEFLRLENEAMQALKTTNEGSINWIKWSAILTERTGYKFDIAHTPTIIPADMEG